MRAVGLSTRDETNAKAFSRVEGGSNIRGFVAIRTNPDRTRTERANGSGPVANRVSQRVLGPLRSRVFETRADQHIDIGKEHGAMLTHRLNRATSSFASSDPGESRSTPGEMRALRTVIEWIGGESDGACRLSASSSVLEMNAHTLTPWAAALRRTCLPGRSSSDIVVLMMQRIINSHQCINRNRHLSLLWREENRHSQKPECPDEEIAEDS